MGFVKVTASIGASREDLQEVEFLVDTGSFYTVLPPPLASNLGISASSFTAQATLADKRTVQFPVALAYLSLMDRETVVLAGIFDVPIPLLGVRDLEGLGLIVDPIKGTLEAFLPFGNILF
jgi:clan AA aspartic protease